VKVFDAVHKCHRHRSLQQERGRATKLPQKTSEHKPGKPVFAIDPNRNRDRNLNLDPSWEITIRIRIKRATKQISAARFNLGCSFSIL
jgi:hypothetical protein